MHVNGLSLLPAAPDGTILTRLRWSKAVKDFRMKAVYEPKTYNFRDALMTDILAAAALPAPKETEPRVSGVMPSLFLMSKNKQLPEHAFIHGRQYLNQVVISYPGWI